MIKRIIRDEVLLDVLCTLKQVRASLLASPDYTHRKNDVHELERSIEQIEVARKAPYGVCA